MPMRGQALAGQVEEDIMTPKLPAAPWRNSPCPWPSVQRCLSEGAVGPSKILKGIRWWQVLPRGEEGQDQRKRSQKKVCQIQWKGRLAAGC